MKISNNTVLITGGSAGIGFEIAKLFSEKGNQVIITGRNKERLQKAASKIKNATAIPCDVTNEQEVNSLVKRLQEEFPELNILINNAARAYAYKLSANAGALNKAKEEMLTNYLSVISLTEKLLPLLQQKTEAAVINVSSVVAFVPSKVAPTYAASKSALHSYTQSLRLTLAQSTAIKVFELMPPLVNTDFSQEIGGINGIHPSVVAEDLLKAFENDKYEIHVGQTEQLYQLSLSSPADALLAINSRS